MMDRQAGLRTQLMRRRYGKGWSMKLSLADRVPEGPHRLELHLGAFSETSWWEFRVGHERVVR